MANHILLVQQDIDGTPATHGPRMSNPEVFRTLKHQQDDADKENKRKEGHRKEKGEDKDGDAAVGQEDEERESELCGGAMKGNPQHPPEDYVYEPGDSTLPTDVQELFAGSAGISKACIDMGLVVGNPWT